MKIHRFYDNSDGTITIDCLVKRRLSCFNNCIEQLEEKYAGTIQELKAKRPKSGIIIKPGVSKNIGETQALIREINYKLQIKLRSTTDFIGQENVGNQHSVSHSH